MSTLAEIVAQSRSATQIWQELGFLGRKKVLKAWAKTLNSNIDLVAKLISEETGKPISDAGLEATVAINHLLWVAKNAEKILRTQTRPSGLLFLNIKSRVAKIPYGVVGVIGPWNYPMHTPMGSISYALAAGNTVVFKPSEIGRAHV